MSRSPSLPNPSQVPQQQHLRSINWTKDGNWVRIEGFGVRRLGLSEGGVGRIVLCPGREGVILVCVSIMIYCAWIRSREGFTFWFAFNTVMKWVVGYCRRTVSVHQMDFVVCVCWTVYERRDWFSSNKGWYSSAPRETVGLMSSAMPLHFFRCLSRPLANPFASSNSSLGARNEMDTLKGSYKHLYKCYFSATSQVKSTL